MKLFVISLLILALLAATVHLTSRHASDALERLTDALGDAPTDAEKVDGIRRRWETDEKFFSLILDRRELSAIDSHIAELEGAVRAGNRDMILIAHKKLTAALKGVRTELRPTIAHLF